MLPDFLGIGAHKAGTGWLSHNLRKHPDILMPPLKEIHYFDRAITYPSPNHLAFNSIFARLLCRMRFFMSVVAKNRDFLRRQRLSWGFRYLFGKCNDEWYASLFEPDKGKITGEITPAYSMLALEDIKRIRKIMPKVKLIYIMRNPIDRAWSSLKYNAMRHRRSINAYPREELIREIESRGYRLRGDYLRTINNWQTYFPRKQIFIGFFDDIVMTPEDILLRLYEFLGISADQRYLSKNAYVKFNASPEVTIPHQIKVYLGRNYYPQIKKLSEQFGGHATSWLKDTERFL